MSAEASERLTVAEAAQRLGISQDAVRKRIKRDSIRHERGEDGRVYVYLDASETTQDIDQDHDQDVLVARLENEVRFLREELARKDAILLNMTEAMKALTPPPREEAPQEPPQAPEPATEQPGRVEPQTTIEAADEAERAGRAPSESAMGGGSLRRPWWRRLFGG